MFVNVALEAESRYMWMIRWWLGGLASLSGTFMIIMYYIGILTIFN